VRPADAGDLPALPEGEGRPTAARRDLRAAVTLVSAWVGQLARDLAIDPVLVGTRSDIEAMVRGDADARMQTGWRHDLVGGPVDELLSGRAALAFDGRGELILIPRRP